MTTDDRKTTGQPKPTVCAECGGKIEPDDLKCPHCGVSLVAG